jgi:hypothetical protein
VAAGGGRVGLSFIQGVIDRFKHPRQIAINVAIPKSKNAKPLSCEFRIAAQVTCAMSIQVVLPAIDLDDAAVLHTNKVNDIAFAR